jgi:GNAT superfamily N-acetyltransferase
VSASLTIRDYATGDWPDVCRVHDRSRPDELRGSFDERAFIPLAEDPEGKYIDACEVFVAEVEGELVGFAGIDTPYLAWLYVQPSHYRQGIGHALLKHSLERLGDDAWAITCGNNTGALDLYLKAGFVVEKRFSGENGGYEGPLVRIALNPDRRGWLKRNKSDQP